MEDPKSRLARRIGWYAQATTRSPTYSLLLGHAADDILAGGPVWAVLSGRENDPRGSALALRLMGAVHRIVLRGDAPELAAHYRSVGGTKGPDGAWEPFRRVLLAHADVLRDEVRQPVQTNEVGRAAALVGGFLVVAHGSGLPLRVLELGASAGLNLRWDRYSYEARGQRWGPENSPVRLCDFATPPTPPFGVQATVAERRGCDRNPLDPTTEEGRLTLLSFVWADQVWRVRRLRAALDVARRFPAAVDRANAPEWLEQQLSRDSSGLATVVFHSIMMQYLDEGDRDRICKILESAGAAASASAPLAWLRMEPAGDHTDVRLTMWPGGRERLIARSGYHGAPVEWIGWHS
ncbi:MAG: DUF2332 domain-containing protein [Actinomycetota bacterium]|nr:DUF2332 domain-containing protein [Actinomycetota bacterium]